MKAILMALGLLAALSAHADPMPDYYGVLSSVTVSFKEDGGFDRAVLVQPSRDADHADLYVYLSSFNEQTRTYDVSLALKKEAAVPMGGVWGMQPSLSVNSRGSLEINSGTNGTGHTRWSQTLTVIYRNKEFLIVGISHASRDTLDPTLGGNCDLNLLTGRGRRNGRLVVTALKPIRLAEWRDDLLPKECLFR